ncbi:ecdysone-induced protein 74EF-like [Drosophila innubila]|uniref:ecdysone-induced protein 74EF-like n=1 Tax=Drosophila innubila TaxID=198719 RepID=UPI00148D5C36|nr:ecdysone-induced protein 74EF-like [Drosophila innubila]
MSNMNNNANKKHSYERKSSRVTPKIREYLAEIANEREVDLERFMVLSSSSPASSGVSVGAQSSNNEATVAAATTTMRSSSSRCRSRSRVSGLGVGVTTTAVAVKKNAAKEEVKITDIPIVMVVETECKELPPKASSVEDLRTPTKCTKTDAETETEMATPQMQTRKTQTPESALRSHKRLEWDPAADVGYQRCERAVSTSNISTLERSVLEAATLQRPNQSESDLNRLKTATTLAGTAPPLASSTLVHRSGGCSQAQVTPVPRSTPLASTNPSSRRESCLTSAASSFDYQHNSRPSTAGNSHSHSNTTTSSRHSLCAEELLRHMEQQRQEREYSAQLEQVLSRRRQVYNKENQQPKKQSKNKSNNSNNNSVSLSASTASSSSCAMAKNDVDLGIDLLCSLVNKRSLSNSQKKQLAKDIIKRLVGFELISSRSSTRNNTGNSARNNTANRNSSSSQLKEQSQQTEQMCPTRGKDIATNTSRRSSLILPRSPPEQLHLAVPVPAPRTRLAATPTESSPVQVSCSYSSTSSGASNDLVTQKTNPPAAKSKSTDAAEQLAMQEYLNPMTQSEIEYEEKRQRQQRDNLSMERRTQIDWIDAEIRRLCALQNLLRRSGRGDLASDETLHQWKDQRKPEQHVEAEQEVQPEVGQRLPATGGRPAPPAPPVTPVFMPGEGRQAGGEAEDGANGENAEGRSGATGVSSGAGVTSSGASSGAGAPSGASSGAGTATGGATTAPLGVGAATRAEGVSSGANSRAEAPSGASSGAGAPTSGSSSGASPLQPPALPATVTAATATVAPAVRLRSKMATPALSHSGSSESVCSFVQQRQRQFLAHYQNQQQQRLEQQQQLFMLQQQQQLIHRQQQQQQQQHLHAACHISQRQQHCHHHHEQQQQQQQHQHYVQMQYAQAVGNAYSCLDDGAVYYHVLNSQDVKGVATAATTVATAAAAAATAVATTATVATAAAAVGVTCNSCNTGSNMSSSSLLCLSSEMSIPMGGMLNACEATTTTTTTTTTHQYDDVACQQLQLQMQQQRRRRYPVKQPMHLQQQMLQVRPSGIAYVLQFASNNDYVGQVLHASMTVQDYLQRARPQFCAQSKQRKAILNQMQLLRNARRRELDELIEGNSLETIDRRLQQLPPPVTSKVRIFSTKEMKALTNKRCENLPEVLAAQNREKEERRRRSNRIMRDVFNKRLQRRVRSGKLSLNHSRTVI